MPTADPKTNGQVDRGLIERVDQHVSTSRVMRAVHTIATPADRSRTALASYGFACSVLGAFLYAAIERLT